MNDRLTANQIVGFADGADDVTKIRAIQDVYHCTLREATRLLIAAKRAVAQGYGNNVLGSPPQVRAANGRQEATTNAVTPEQQEFIRMTDKYMNPPEPSVDERMHAQWQERDLEVQRRNLAQGYDEKHFRAWLRGQGTESK